MLGWSISAHNSFNRFRGIDGVYRRQDEVSSFSRLQTHFHGFAITHFPDQDDTGSLPQSCTHSHDDAWSIAVQLPLMNRRKLVIVQKLDWVFYGDDVAS